MGRDRRHPRRDQGPRADERQADRLPGRRRHPRIRQLCHRAADQGGGEAVSRIVRPHREAADPGGRRHSRLLPRRRARACACLPLSHRRPRGRHAPRLPRGEARHLPGPQRHGALDPACRPDGRHDRHAHGAHAAPDRGEGHGPHRSGRLHPSQSPLGGAESGAAEAPLEGRAVVEAGHAEAAGARAACQADALQDRGQGARGPLPRALPADRSLRAIWRRPRAHADGRDGDLRAAHGERHLAQSPPRVHALRDAEGRSAEERLQAQIRACRRRRHHGRRHRRLVRGVRHAGELAGSRRGTAQEGARPRQGPVQEAAPRQGCDRRCCCAPHRRPQGQTRQACRCGDRGDRGEARGQAEAVRGA